MSGFSTYKPRSRLGRWIDSRLPVIRFAHDTAVSYPVPRNLNYFWTFGGVLTFMLAAQIVTGIFLAMHYVPNSDLAFQSIERIMRDVNSGWLIRYLHANGASMFFIAVYIHIFRGLYYGSYKAPREIIWVLGITNLLIMMATAFLGYVLPWGQMSFWGATVITNLFSAIPLVGETIVEYLWGGYSVGNPTLNRFFSLHYLLPFMLVGTVTLHIWALHHVGQNNPTGVEVTDFKKDTVPFTPYATVKDVFGIACFMIFFAYWVFYIPNYLGHADNYIPANPAVTPAHIVPEWYFLPFYAVLRAVPDKLGGVSRCSWQSSSWRSCPGLRPPRCARCTIVRLRGLCSGCLLSHSLALGTSAACRQRAAMWSPLGSSQCCTWDTLLLYLWSACLKGHYRCPCRSLSLY